MKRLLVLVLLVLWLAADASAPVPLKHKLLIYSFKQKTTEYTYDSNMMEWDKSIKNSTGYLIVQWTSDVSLSVWTVLTEKRNDVNPDGKMHKWASASGPAEFSIAQAGIGNKTTWLVGCNYVSEHTLLTGEEKPIKILDKTGNAATKLAGTSTWNYEQDSILHVGSSVISLSWQSKLTNEYYSDDSLFDGEGAVSLLMDYLESKGYGNGP